MTGVEPVAAPARVVPSETPADRVPVWTLDGFTFRGDGLPDELGRQWIIEPEGEKGWTSPPRRRNRRDDKPDSDGAYRGRSYTGEKIITLSGHVGCQSADDLADVETALAAICSNGRRLYPLRRTTARYDQTMNVELDDDPLVEPVSLLTVKFSLQLGAPDPRKHAAAWQETRAYSPPGGPGGLDYGSVGLSYTGTGLDYGTTAYSTPALVENRGTDVARPLFSLVGPLNNPAVVCVDTGEVHSYLDNIDPGETVWINCDEFNARGVPARSAVSSVRGDVTALFAIGLAWPEVAPGQTASYQLLGTGLGNSLTAALRSAWK